MKWLCFAFFAGASLAQDITFTNRVATFTNLQGTVYKDVTLTKADLDGVIYREEAGGGRVCYTNLSPAVLEAWGIPTNRIETARARAKRKAAAAVAEAQYRRSVSAAVKAAQPKESPAEIVYYMNTLDNSTRYYYYDGVCRNKTGHRLSVKVSFDRFVLTEGQYIRGTPATMTFDNVAPHDKVTARMGIDAADSLRGVREVSVKEYDASGTARDNDVPVHVRFCTPDEVQAVVPAL
jgi:hypothetical protein